MTNLRTDVAYVGPDGKFTQAGVSAIGGAIKRLEALIAQGIVVSNFDAAAIVTLAETIAANNNDTTLPTSAAVDGHVSARVMPVTAAAAVDAVGAYALLRQTTTSTARSPGDIVAGSNLRYENIVANAGGGAPPGDWMCCGAIPSSAAAQSNTTLWRRVS